MNKILIHKGDCTIFAECQKFLTFNIKTSLDLTGWTAKFVLGWITKEIEDISSKQFEIILSSEDTKQLRLGDHCGSIILKDSNGNIKTITNTIPFEVTYEVVENEYQEIDLSIPESSGVDLTLRVGSVGSGGVTSYEHLSGLPKINNVELVGNKSLKDLGIQPIGDYLTEHQDISNLATKDEIPNIEGLITQDQLEQGLATKQAVGDYVTREEFNAVLGDIETLLSEV